MFKIKMAGLTIQINNRYKYIQMQCEDYITETGDADFTVSATKEELLAQRDVDDETCTPAYCESLCIYRNICMQMLAYDGFLIHGAAIAVDGDTYLFLAKSGIGKTTHIRNWKKIFGDRAVIVNGDKPIVRRIDNQWYVCGSPWCGKEDLGNNTMASLKAICFLEQSKENHIKPLEAEQVTERIFHQLLMPNEEEQVSAFFLLLEDCLEKTPCYLLQCNLDSSSAVVAYEGMQQIKDS